MDRCEDTDGLMDAQMAFDWWVKGRVYYNKGADKKGELKRAPIKRRELNKAPIIRACINKGANKRGLINYGER